MRIFHAVDYFFRFLGNIKCLLLGKFYNFVCGYERNYCHVGEK